MSYRDFGYAEIKDFNWSKILIGASCNGRSEYVISA